MTLTDQELASLYDRYAHILLRRCRAILGNDEDARDAVQETFAKVIRYHAEFRSQASPLTWMYRISTNHCLNQLRDRGGRARKLEDRRHDVLVEESSRPTDDGPDRQAILRMLESADAETRACVIHTFFDDCTRQETADLVGLSVPTVRKRVNEFLERARAELGVALILVLAFSATPWSIG